MHPGGWSAPPWPAQPGLGGQWPPGPPFYDPPPRGRGVGRFVLPALLLLILGGSILLNLALVAGAVDGADDPQVITQTVAQGDPKQTIAVVELGGEIDGDLAARFDRLLARVERDAESGHPVAGGPPSRGARRVADDPTAVPIRGKCWVLGASVVSSSRFSDSPKGWVRTGTNSRNVPKASASS